MGIIVNTLKSSEVKLVNFYIPRKIKRFIYLAKMKTFTNTGKLLTKYRKGV